MRSDSISSRRNRGPLMKARAALFVALAACSSIGVAAPCAGFNDVDSTSSFCANVEWIKNRKVTLGCLAAQYCPSDAVSRLQMAAFMNRLGTALTPTIVRVELASGAQDLDASPVVCQSTDYAVADFPRQVLVDAIVSATATTNVNLMLRAVFSTNAGGTWQPLSAAQSLTFIAGTQWGQLSESAALNLSVGQTVRFGAQLSRSGAGTTDLADSRCLLRAQIGSRNGPASPF